MPLLPTLGRTVGTGIRAVRMVVRGSVRGSAWATRRVGSARARGAANEVGMIRLFDLHAISCAGDALIAIGLAGTIFSVPLGEARSKVALYLLITMVPFALLAPVVGPLLDHFRHGRRYALATTMLGRAFLAYVMADNLLGWGLYPAAFGVLALSRAYGVARSAAVPRLLPAGVGLSQVGARASVYGTFAGILVAPIGLLAFKFGPQWPLRVATVIFMIGVVVSLRLPPRADSDPPEAMPRPWRAVLRVGRGADRPLANRLVLATLIGSASLRLLYGFLLLFLTFAIMGNDLNTTVFGAELSRGAAVGVVGAALALGTFLSTAAGTGLTIRRPLALQSSGLVLTAGVAVLATIFYNLATVTLLALFTAIFSGIAKLAVDASIQERVPEKLRATAFAHSETVLMLAWVAGGGIGLIPLTGRFGIALAAVLAVLGAGRAAWAAARMHNERLAGRPDAEAATDPNRRDDDAVVELKDLEDPPEYGPGVDPHSGLGSHAGPGSGLHSGPRSGVGAGPRSGAGAGPRSGAGFDPGDGPDSALPADPWPDAPTVPGPSSAPPQRRSPATRGTTGGSDPRHTDSTSQGRGSRTNGEPSKAGGIGDRRAPDRSVEANPGAESGRRGRSVQTSQGVGAESAESRGLDPTLVEPPAVRKWWRGWREDKPADSRPQVGSPPDDERTARSERGPRDERLSRAERSASEQRPAHADLGGSEERAPGDSEQRAGGSAPPGYHVYRPSSAGSGTRNGEPGSGEES